METGWFEAHELMAWGTFFDVLSDFGIKEQALIFNWCEINAQNDIPNDSNGHQVVYFFNSRNSYANVAEARAWSVTIIFLCEDHQEPPHNWRKRAVEVHRIQDVKKYTYFASNWGEPLVKTDYKEIKFWME